MINAAYYVNDNCEMLDTEFGCFIVKQTIVRGGAPYRVFSVWQATSQYAGDRFSTITTIELRDGSKSWYGQVGTERLPAKLDALPAMSEERYQAVKAWRGAQYDLAYSLIEASSFDTRGCTRDMGELRD